jgi:DNA-binding beta-propeller fold protein YncE
MMADAASLSAPNPPVLGGKQMNGTNRSGRSAAWASYVLAASLAAMSTTALAQEADYEIWALDQGTHMLHMYDGALEEVDRIDLGAESIEVPHMISFTPDHSHAVIASTRSGDVTVIRTGDRKIVASIKTGPGTHMAGARPDGGAIIADVIGAGDVPRDGKVVEITAGDDGSFTLGRELVIAEDPLFVENESRFNDVAAICHDFSADGRYAYVTLGPGLADGGLVVLDTDSFTLAKVFPPDELKVNCGTARTVDGSKMFVTGGGADVGA